MTPTDKCPKCGQPLRGHSFLQCVIDQRDQLATKLTALESAYAECADKLYRAEQREHDFKRRLADMTKQRDRLEQRVSELELLAQGRGISRDIIMDAELSSLRGFAERMGNTP